MHAAQIAFPFFRSQAACACAAILTAVSLFLLIAVPHVTSGHGYWNSMQSLLILHVLLDSTVAEKLFFVSPQDVVLSEDDEDAEERFSQSRGQLPRWQGAKHRGFA